MGSTRWNCKTRQRPCRKLAISRYYYAALFPFFFLAGFAVSLNFVVHANQVGRVYGYDLLGAGSGACLALLLMLLLHPFQLVPALLPFLALAAILSAKRAWRIAAVAALGGSGSGDISFRQSTHQ